MNPRTALAMLAFTGTCTLGASVASADLPITSSTETSAAGIPIPDGAGMLRQLSDPSRMVILSSSWGIPFATSAGPLRRGGST